MRAFDLDLSLRRARRCSTSRRRPTIAAMLLSITQELGIDRAAGIDEALQRLAGGAMRPTNEVRLRTAEACLDAMINRLRQLLAIR
jgi:hypothetical protein